MWTQEWLLNPAKTDKGQPRYLQLYAHLRAAIVNGQLRPGQRIPSSRMLARNLGVARGTVILAYEQMTMEGYFVSYKGDGTYVAKELPEAFHLRQPHTAGDKSHMLSGRSLSKRMNGQLNGPNRTGFRLSQYRPFQPGISPIDVFPRTTLARIASTVYRSASFEQLGYGGGAGYRPLREALASYLGMTRGLACTADQVIITSGSQQSFTLVCEVLLDREEQVWMEDPGYTGARIAFERAGQQVVPVPLDKEGVCVEVGIANASKAKMAYVTPAHQYPAGVTMSLQRRLQLIQWASQNGSWILEDDYDGEFRYKGRPLATLHSLDPNRRVMYAGSLSKVLAPALRLGYLIVPDDLIEAFTFAKTASDRHCPTLQQAIMARFIAEGHFERHLRRIRTLCKERQVFLLEAANKYLKKAVILEPDPAGLHLVGLLQNREDDSVVSEAAASRNLIVPAMSSFCEAHPYTPSLILGYSLFTQPEIDKATKQLSQVVSTKVASIT